MVPKLHAKGTSFKGAAAYLLHDKGRAKTAQRVAWVEMRNLITDDPHVAWRVMAATAMDQDRLKELAGVKNTGRKSSASVLHLT
ncbi:MAG: relaxase/mobilization nuclease domain-containing protein, partial [Acidobacteria bacterium]|nr:relaxase/mobilization nuclease domain-containing protein [Acidobacteriota bacterium]